ncbi:MULTISPECIES: hypothetical protein [Burkholderia]|uniref:hypothetical protein n=1 Tax=Burkholderia TaxID=32008 RepID=UPI0011B1F5B6|nr:hypothetical protein [Burkholderia multivorans]MBJ9655201.1 hypothetical protein [Burkholderia multivorans]MBR8043982.1 hypothetical protein [Burkholderia multivorans]MBU9442394.1 hypothetical protein [Burkholderia multivorans]MCA8223117.1 hypothetical protein [Burkholderia multivorans]
MKAARRNSQLHDDGFQLTGIGEDEVMSQLAFKIFEAFGWRKKPDILIGSSELTCDEVDGVHAIGAYEWGETTGDLWEKYNDALSWFSPEAFCYYIPGVMVSSINDNEPNLIVVNNLVGMLDRTPNPSWWDDFFVERWPLLTTKECGVLKEWLAWLSSFENSSIDKNSFYRALETVDLLISRNTAS